MPRPALEKFACEVRLQLLLHFVLARPQLAMPYESNVRLGVLGRLRHAPTAVCSEHHNTTDGQCLPRAHPTGR